MTPKKMSLGNKTSEELASKAEILLDSATQRALSALAYLRILKEKARQEQGFRQLTITSPGNEINPKKPWNFQIRNPEHGFKAECWTCHKVFTKRVECATCKLYICPFCESCGCKLSPEARGAVYAVLRTVFGIVSEPELNIYPEPKEVGSVSGEA